MKLKIALSVVLGLFIGGAAGTRLGFMAANQFVGTLVASQVESRYADRILLLKLLDDEKMEAMRLMLLTNVQSDTIAAATALQQTAPDDPQRLLRFVRLSADLKSVRQDRSELGKEAADTRAKLDSTRLKAATASP